MRMVVRGVTPADYERWIENQKKPALTPKDGTVAKAGEDVFKNQLCSSCHLIRGVNDAKVNDPVAGVKSQLVCGVAGPHPLRQPRHLLGASSTATTRTPPTPSPVTSPSARPAP